MLLWQLRRMKTIILFLTLLTSTLSFALGHLELRTLAEMSGWKKTGRAQETERLCRDFALSYPKHIKCEVYGKTPEGRTLHSIIVVGEGFKNSDPTIWVQAGIHAGEIDGKDAVFLLLREIFQENKYSEVLKGLRLVFVPIVNLDGHERFEKFNRPNQTGPEEMGWRTTAQNLNLNRDFAKAEAPEMVALLKLWQKYQPILSLDLHVTDGAQFQPEVGIITTTLLKNSGKMLESALMEKMLARNVKALPFYPSFERDDDPTSGFARYVSSPRFSQGYWSHQNRLGMLVETHSWKDYANRVHSHHETVLSVLELAHTQGEKWLKEARELDQRKIGSTDVDLEFKHSEKFKTIEFPGYEYKISSSEISGKKMITYDPKVPQIWKVPLYEELIPSLTVTAPSKGYFIPPTLADWMSEKLKIHGIRFERVKVSKNERLQVFRATKTLFSPGPFEGRQTLVVEGQWIQETVTILASSLFVPIDQKNSQLILQLLEPRAKDSFLAWGFMNAYFEQKEYMEDYVTEVVALEMLKDVKIKEEFEARLKDEEFEKSAPMRLGFFYQKHPSWDRKFNLYPIYKN
jgi:Zinc carboxypeptidase